MEDGEREVAMQHVKMSQATGVTRIYIRIRSRSLSILRADSFPCLLPPRLLSVPKPVSPRFSPRWREALASGFGLAQDWSFGAAQDGQDQSAG